MPNYQGGRSTWSAALFVLSFPKASKRRLGRLSRKRHLRLSLNYSFEWNNSSIAALGWHLKSSKTLIHHAESHTQNLYRMHHSRLIPSYNEAPAENIIILLP